MDLESALRGVGAIQIVVSGANAVLPGKLRYGEELSRVSPIIRQIFYVHHIYIAGTVLALGLVCLLAPEWLLGRDAASVAMRLFIAVFWTARIPIQIFYYDPAVKQENRALSGLFLLALSCVSITAWTAVWFGGTR